MNKYWEICEEKKMVFQKNINWEICLETNTISTKNFSGTFICESEEN